MRKIYNILADMFNRAPKGHLKFDTFAYRLKFPDRASYVQEFRYYLKKKLKFEEYTADPRSEQKQYPEMNVGAYFQVYNHRKATLETLKSFRLYFPNSPVYLLSDRGEDFSDIARHFRCDYEYADVNLGYWPCKDILGWFERLNKVCEKYTGCDWIILLEDDVRVRDRISKYPPGHMAGQGGGGNSPEGHKQLSLQAKQHIWQKYPGLEINGISGCGGSIFHRRSFMDCYKNISLYNVEKLKSLDRGLSWATDFALTYLFLLNGMIVRRWFDLSWENQGGYGPASAFDHQFKKYYASALTEEDAHKIKHSDN